VPLATWLQRVGAGLVDLLLQGVLLAVVLLVARGLTESILTASRDWADQVAASLAGGKLTFPEVPVALARAAEQLTLIEVGIAFVYSLAFLLSWGATPGMRLLGLRVIPAAPLELVPGAALPRTVTAQQARARLPWGRAVWRSLTWAILASGLYFFALLQVFSLLMPLWHPRRQTIHDLLARTLVAGRP
jgi:uncharacterized RDD family membrane protein YckC